MPEWTLDTRIDITDAGRAHILRQRQSPRRMLRCRICDDPVRVACDDEPTTEPVTCEECSREEEEPNPYAGTYSED